MERSFLCEFCSSKFSRKYHLERHIQTQHSSPNIVSKCTLCGKTFFERDHLIFHIKNTHPPSKNFSVVESAFKRKFLTYRYKFDKNISTLEQTLNSQMTNKIVKTVRHETARKHSIRVGLILTANLSMEDGEGKCINEATTHFRGKSFVVNNYTMKQIFKLVRDSYREIENAIEKFSQNGSNWQFNFPICLDIQISKTRPLSGGNNTIKDLNNSKFLLNISSQSKGDQFCFLYCIAAALFAHTLPKKQQNQSKAYSKLIKNKFNIQGLSFPLSIDEISIFCKNNPHLDLKINVLFHSFDKEIYPLKTNIGNGQNIINLLLVEIEATKYHYVVITDVNKFLRKNYLSNSGYRSYKKEFFCLSCFNSFSSNKVLNDHEENHCSSKPKREIPPREGENKIRFTKHERKFKNELVGFLDFECILPSSNICCTQCKSLRCKCDISSTTELSSHKPIAYSFLIVNSKNEIVLEKNYCGKNAAQHFVDMLLNEEELWINEFLNRNVEMEELTEDEELLYENSTECHICNLPFKKDEIRCKDHCHITGKFIAAAHQVCNLHRQLQSKINIYLHNGSKYDMHLIIKTLSNPKVKNLHVLPFNSEHFRTVSFNSFQICDSLQFLSASLDALASDLYDSKHSYPLLQQSKILKPFNGEEKSKRLNLIKQGKSYFPYEYCTSLKKMKETIAIPPRVKFYSQLKEEHLSAENYMYAKTVWHAFNCQNLADYTVLYCSIDTYLLAEVMT